MDTYATIYTYRYSKTSLNRLIIVCFVAALRQRNSISVGGDMMQEMRRNPEPKLVPTQRIFNLPHHIGMV